MKAPAKKSVRCAIYTCVSTDQGLEQDFNSLDAQYDASQAYIRSQSHAGWTLLRAKYDDGAAVELYARGLSTRDIEDAFTDEAGRHLPAHAARILNAG
jgi:hypothetical protein